MINKKQIAIDFAKSLNHPEIQKIVLFGSVAWEEYDADSDILILITDYYKIKDSIFHKVNEIFLKTMEYLSVKCISRTL